MGEELDRGSRGESTVLVKCIKCLIHDPAAQLCDDNFEEHVLAYSAEKTGRDALSP